MSWTTFYSDPARLVACNVPLSWCLDAESCLFRQVLGPWHTTETRLVLTSREPSTGANADVETWARSASATAPLERARLRFDLGDGAALIGSATGSDGTEFIRTIVRGRTSEIVADLTAPDIDPGAPPPDYLRLLRGMRSPARSQEETFNRLDAVTADAFETLQRLGESGESDSEEYPRLIEFVHARSLECFVAGGQSAATGDRALDWLNVHIMFNCLSAVATKLRVGHALLMRARPSRSATPSPAVWGWTPAQEQIDSHVLPSFSEFARRTRELDEAGQWAHLDNDTFGSDKWLQIVLGRHIIEEARTALRTGTAAPADIAGGLWTLLSGIAYGAPAEVVREGVQVYSGDLYWVGQGLIRYLDAIGDRELFDDTMESAELLGELGQLIADGAPRYVPGMSAPLSSAGRYFQGLSSLRRGETLGAIGDEAALQAADRLLADAADHLANTTDTTLVSAADVAQDTEQVCYLRALCNAQLGRRESVVSAVRAGLEVPPGDDDRRQSTRRQLNWLQRLVDLDVVRDGVEQSVPDLYVGEAKARGDDSWLAEGTAHFLEQRLAETAVRTDTIEYLAIAARLLHNPVDDRDSIALTEAALLLLDLKRLFSLGRADIQIGADDSLLARQLYEHLISAHSAEHRAASALTRAERARGRSTYLATLARPADSDANIAALEQRESTTLRSIFDETDAISPRPSSRGPLWPFRFLHTLAGRLEHRVAAALTSLGSQPLDFGEIASTVAALDHPVVVYQIIDDRIAIFVVLPDGSVDEIWPDARAAEISAAVGVLHEVMPHLTLLRREVAQSDVVQDDAALLAPARNLLHATLVEPIRPHLLSHRHVAFVPYRELFGVPFAALAHTDPVADPLDQRHAAPYVVASIATLRALRDRATPDGRQAYVVSDPLLPVGSGISPLPGAALEGDEVAAMLRTNGWSVTHRNGAQASVTSYVHEAPGASLVHFACHSFPGEDGAAVLQLAPEPNSPSGALTSDDIATVPLDGAFVFLASCRSASARWAAEGAVGLARALLQAGAAAIVVSHWPVLDDATRLLAGRYYASLLAGSTVAEALQQAALSTVPGGRPSSSGALSLPFYVYGDGTAMIAAQR